MRLFHKDNPKVCEYCAWADKTTGEEMLCYHKGPVDSDYHCRKFKYDPYKRIPGKNMAVKPLVLRNIDSGSSEGL